MENNENYIQLRELQHFNYCRRQWGLIFLENVWNENLQTVYGSIYHDKKVHTQLYSEKRGSLIKTYDLYVISRELQLYGFCDCVEFHKREKGAKIFGYDGYYEIIPVEYKVGSEQQADLFQAAGQAICLEEMFSTTVSKYCLYYKRENKRLEYELAEELKQQIRAYTLEILEYKKRKFTPKVKKGKKCTYCSLKDYCIPKLQGKSAQAYFKKKLENL